MGACGKSAQLPLHTWLPDAMEGPTPVSALIHAATMVTAGVYMVARSRVIFEHSPVALEVVAWIGVATALFAASIGLVQTDIKRVLAYSTVSQLGYMFAAVGVGAYAAGIFHLVTHAFFKALLFLGAGSVIHGLGGEQDLQEDGRSFVSDGRDDDHHDDRRARTRRNAGARRLLLEGRNPGGRLRQRPQGDLGAPAAGRLSDVVLYRPDAVPGLLQRPADDAETRPTTSTSRPAVMTFPSGSWRC